MVVQLSYFGSYFADLPPFETVFGIQNLPVLLLELPQLRVYIESSSKIRLPLFVAVLRQVSANTCMETG